MMELLAGINRSGSGSNRNVLNYNKITYFLKTVITSLSDGFFWTFFFLNITTEHKQYSDYIYMIVHIVQIVQLYKLYKVYYFVVRRACENGHF